MNLTNNEHNVLEGLKREELAAYKTSALEKRKWEIDLGPQEVYTWIISTS